MQCTGPLLPSSREEGTVSAFATAPTRQLSNADRCDRCGAQAFVKTTLPTGLELLWCGHHFAANAHKLEADRATITVDERAMIDAA
jgi:hypothetical protein